MNRIGINLWNWSNEPLREYETWISRAADMGFGAVELPMTDLDGVCWEKVGQLAREKDLEITMCASLPSGRDISSFKGEERENAREYLLRCCRIGGILGAKALAGPVYSGGGKRHHLTAEEKKLEWDYAVEGLKEIAAKAKENGLTLGIEPINRYRTSMVNTVEQGMRMVEAIGMDNVGLLYDTYQANIEEADMAGALQMAAQQGKLVHFHACENNRQPPGSGHIDWVSLTGILKQWGYGGHWTMELFCQGGLDAPWQCGSDRDKEAKKGLAYLRSLFREADA